MTTELATADGMTQETPAEEIRAEVEAVDPGPLPINEDQATLYRVLRLRGRLEDERNRIAAAAEAMIKQIDNRIQGLDFYYTPLLADITRKMIGNGKVKSVKTPFGTVGFRTSPVRVAVVDPDKVPDNLAEIVQMRKVLASKVSEHFKATGEIPAGCELVPASEKFYAK